MMRVLWILAAASGVFCAVIGFPGASRGETVAGSLLALAGAVVPYVILRSVEAIGRYK